MLPASTCHLQDSPTPIAKTCHEHVATSFTQKNGTSLTQKNRTMGLLYFSSTPPSRVEIFPKQIHGHRGIDHGRLQMTRAAYLESGRGPQDVECRFNKECNAIKPGGLGYWEVCHQQTAEDKVSRSHSARQYPPHEPQTLELVDMTAFIGERGMFFQNSHHNMFGGKQPPAASHPFPGSIAPTSCP